MGDDKLRVTTVCPLGGFPSVVLSSSAAKEAYPGRRNGQDRLGRGAESKRNLVVNLGAKVAKER